MYRLYEIILFLMTLLFIRNIGQNSSRHKTFCSNTMFSIIGSHCEEIGITFAVIGDYGRGFLEYKFDCCN